MSDITHVGMYVRMYVYVYTYVYCYLKLFHSDTLPSDGTYMYMYMYMYVKFTYIIGASLSEPHMDGTSAIFHILLLLLLSYVRRGLCDPFFFFLRRALCGLDLYTVQSSCILHTKMDSVDKREKCLQRRRKRERSRRASETAEEREERLRKRRVRDRARRAAHSASAREIDLQQRRERSAAESPESREARLQRMRDRLVAETDEERGQATADERQVGS